MPWFMVDDTLALHRKAVLAGNAAMGLWVRAGSWSAQQLTDGYIPATVVRQLGSTGQAKRLVEAGLWEVADSGYRFHQWHENGDGTRRNYSRTEIEQRRRKRAEAGKKGGQQSAESRRAGEAKAKQVLEQVLGESFNPTPHHTTPNGTGDPDGSPYRANMADHVPPDRSPGEDRNHNGKVVDMITRATRSPEAAAK